MNFLKGWKTILFNVVTGILLLVDNMGEGLGIPPAVLETIIVVGNLILRFLTTGESAPIKMLKKK